MVKNWRVGLKRYLAQLPPFLLWWKRSPQRLANRAREAELSLQSTVPSVMSQVSPVSQARDANQLDDIDPYLTKKNKEEHEEAERVVRPVEKRGNQKSQNGLRLIPQHSSHGLTFLFTRSHDAEWESQQSTVYKDPQTIIRKGLPFTAFQFKGPILDPFLTELVKLLNRRTI